MDIKHRFRRALFALCAFGTVLALVGTKCHVDIKPDFVPFVVSIDDRGKLSVTYDGQFVTPVGTFYLTDSPFESLEPGDDVLVAFDHSIEGVPVQSIVRLRDLGKGTATVTPNGGKGATRTGSQKKSRIAIPPGRQQFTVDVDDKDAVQRPAARSTKTWAEPPARGESLPTPTTPPTTTPSRSTSPPTKTSPAKTQPSRSSGLTEPGRSSGR